MSAIFDYLGQSLRASYEYFVACMGAIGTLELVLSIPVVFCVYRLILAPLLGLHVNMGSDKVKKEKKG